MACQFLYCTYLFGLVALHSYAAINDACSADGDCTVTNHEVCGGGRCTCGSGYTVSQGQCVRVDCGPPPSLSNGRRTDGGGTMYMDTAVYACNTGYTISGDGNIGCRADGVWEALTATCEIIDCGTAPTVANGARSDTGTVTTYGSTANYTCNTGYDISGTGTIQCQANGTWESITCSPTDCGQAPMISNGARNDSEQLTTFDSVASYSCNLGYDLSGENSIRCQADGTWENLTATCTIKDCGPAPALANGTHTDGGTTSFGSVVTYTCDSGFSLNGTASLECQADGSWGSLLATCEIDCGAPPVLQNGRAIFASPTTVGTNATYTCDSGFEIAGEAVVLCQMNGTWGTLTGNCTRKVAENENGSNLLGSYSRFVAAFGLVILFLI